MKLLFDQNLSPGLVRSLSDLYPDSIHVRDVRLDSADDSKIWDYALINDLTVVTKDADFVELILVSKRSPKVIWIKRGNCSTKEIEQMLRDNHLKLTSEFFSNFISLF